MDFIVDNKKPIYSITVAGELSNSTPRMLREYEKEGLINPSRINGQRRFSNNDIHFVKNIRFYLEEVGMTITGLKLLYLMAPCWEIKQCGQTECPAYGNCREKCWEAIKKTDSGDMRTCKGCPIYLTDKNNKNLKIHQGVDIGPKCFDVSAKPPSSSQNVNKTIVFDKSLKH
jgi:MerR family transcriptional regulator/heat shock protein HspR